MKKNDILIVKKEHNELSDIAKKKYPFDNLLVFFKFRKKCFQLTPPY